MGTLVGAPVGIGLVAGIAVPAMIIGIPVWVGRKLYEQNKNCTNKFKRNAFIAGGVTASVSRTINNFFVSNPRTRMYNYFRRHSTVGLPSARVEIYIQQIERALDEKKIDKRNNTCLVETRPRQVGRRQVSIVLKIVFYLNGVYKER